MRRIIRYGLTEDKLYRSEVLLTVKGTLLSKFWTLMLKMYMHGGIGNGWYRNTPFGMRSYNIHKNWFKTTLEITQSEIKGFMYYLILMMKMWILKI